MKPTSLEELQEIVRQNNSLQSRGGGSKSALSIPREGVPLVDMTGLAGMQVYQPDEYTFTALAGTRISEVEALLAEHDQYLPFDPPLVEAGATLGGTVASGLSGPGRYRYGGLRDFLLGVKFIDGRGDLVKGGGKVVKNAAGFDLPKLMIGSLGMFGILVQLTFKVFPRPLATHTLGFEFATLAEALNALVILTAAPLEIFALDLAVESEQVILWVQLGGQPETIPARIKRVCALLGMDAGREVAGEAEVQFWRAAREFSWVPSQSALVKVPLTPKKVTAINEKLEGYGAVCRYSVGANLAWVAWLESLDVLDEILQQQSLSGLVILGVSDRQQLGAWKGVSFAQRVKRALDPQEKFVIGEHWLAVAS